MSSGGSLSSSGGVRGGSGAWGDLQRDLEGAVRTLGAPCAACEGVGGSPRWVASVRPAGGWKRFAAVAACGLLLVAASLAWGGGPAQHAVLADAISTHQGAAAGGVATAVRAGSGGGPGRTKAHAAAVDAVLAHAEKAR
jgi:hypothetical protein